MSKATKGIQIVGKYMPPVWIIAAAELVINQQGIVIKDRFGRQDRPATDEELMMAPKIKVEE